MDSLAPALTVLRDYAAARPRATRSGPRVATACVVAALHAGIIAAALVVFPSHPPAPAPTLSIPMVFQPPAPPAPEPETLGTATLPVPVLRQTDTLAELPTVTLPASQGARPPRAPARRARPSRAAAQAQPAPSPAIERPAVVAAAAPADAVRPPAVAAPAASVLAAWESRIHQAVQDALIYPNTARLMHREGRTRVRFDYDRGAVARVSVVATSNLASLDQAAVDAVSRAAIPAPPPEIAGQDRTLLLWVNFTLSGED